MRATILILLSACVASAISSASGAVPATAATAHVESAEPLRYPPARTEAVTDTFHGVAVADPYRWMEDLRSPELATFIDAQNQLSLPRLQNDPAFTAARARIAALEDVYPAQEPGIEVGERTFFRAFVNGAVGLHVLDRDSATSRPLIDGAVLGKETAIKAFVPSPDGSHVAYVVGPAGTDWGEIRIRAVATGKDLPAVLPHVRFEGPLAWTADGVGVVYRRFAAPRDGHREVAAEGAALYLHRLGTLKADDPQLFALPEERRDWSLAFNLPGDGQRLFVYVERGPWGAGNIGGSRAQVQVLNLERSGHLRAGATPLVLTEPDAAYRVLHVEDGHALLYTDRDAPRRRVVRMNLAQPAPTQWQDVIAESDGVLQDVRWLGGRLVAHAMETVRSVVRVYDARGARLQDIELPGAGIVQALHGSADSNSVQLLYSGLLQAPVILHHDLVQATTSVAARGRDVPDLSAFEVRQEWAVSKDGTRVPMFVAARRDLARDGSHPTIVYAYGASSTSALPIFSEDIAAWLQMGGVFAIANLRGGGEFGSAWHRAAIRERKQTTFDDLIAVADHLIAQGWTSPRKLAISGASNGGLLVTATMLQRPDLFGAVLADVPVTDAMRRHLSGNGPQQVEQWGTPEDVAVFPALRAYSPVHNVVAGRCYPPTLITTSRDDDRMPPWHAYKFAAALQAAQGCAAPVLLHVRDSGGHGGGDLSAWFDSAARQLAFAARALGLSEQP